MKIKTFKVEVYFKSPIYYRNFNETFEYLTIIKGQLYTLSIRVKPTKLNLIKYYLKIRPEKYSKTEMEAILKQLRRMAQTTIESKKNIKTKKKTNSK